MQIKLRLLTHKIIICAALFSINAFAITPTLSGTAASNEWPTALGTAEGTRFSNLDDINTTNAGSLIEEKVIDTGVGGGHEGQPLFVNIGTAQAPVMRMFVVTPWPNNLIALDQTGNVLWTYKPNTSQYAQGVACCDIVNKGAAYSNGLVVYNRLDGYVVAVKASTGTLAWQTKVANPANGETLTGAPIIAGGVSGGKKVIVGNSGAEIGIRGWVKALNLTTGKVAWTAFNTGPDKDVLINNTTSNYYAKDKGSNLGQTTWLTGGTMGSDKNSNTLWQQGGSTVWAWFTYDATQNLIFYGTANPGVWNPDMRPGDNKWSSSIIARNADNGVVKWATQLTPHDGWDYDSMNENIVISTNESPSGKALVHFDKNGFAYKLDAANGRILSAPPFVNVTWASGINTTTGLPNLVPEMATHEGIVTSGICPSPLGGKEFAPASFSDKAKKFFIPAINFCTTIQPLKALYLAGTPFWGADIAPGPDWYNPQNFGAGYRPFGELIAWNLDGTKAWSVPENAPFFGGVLSTAGDLVFYGTLDKKFRVVNANNGQIIKSFDLECGVMSNPITFKGTDGIQRVAVYSAIGWLPGGFVGGSCPAANNGDDMGYRGNGKLHIYKLQ